MKILDDVKLDFSDVLLLPKRNQYSSRSQVTLERTLKFKYSKYSWTGIPIMISNMDTTGTIQMAQELQNYKVITCLHKYYKLEDLKDVGLNPEYSAVSTGINDNDLINLAEISPVVFSSVPETLCGPTQSPDPNDIFFKGTSKGIVGKTKN